MHGSTSTKGLSKVESGPSEQPQYSSHNYPPSKNPPHPHVPAYGLPLPAAHCPPPAPAPSTAHAYRPPGLSPYGLDPEVAPTTRLRSSIACRYCRRRNEKELPLCWMSWSLMDLWSDRMHPTNCSDRPFRELWSRYSEATPSGAN